jgi:hypothetical protein
MTKASSPRPSETPKKRSSRGNAKSEAAAPGTQVIAKPDTAADASTRPSAPASPKSATHGRNDVSASVTSAPSHDAIAARAFELSQTRAAWDGNELSDWLEAERELRN